MSVTSRDKVLLSSLVAVLIFVVGVIVVAALATRGGASEVPVLVDPTPTASPTISDAGTGERAEVLRVYDGYQRVFAAALAGGSPDDIDLRQYVGDPLLSEVVATIDFYRRQGIVHRGQPAWEATVTTLRGSGADRSATIEDCFDSTRWEAVFEATGESAAAPGRVERYLVSSTATYFPNIGWLITESRADRSKGC